MPSIDEIDMAVVATCANKTCRRKVRRFSAIETGPWWCARCLRAKIDAAVAALDRPIVVSYEHGRLPDARERQLVVDAVVADLLL